MIYVKTNYKKWWIPSLVFFANIFGRQSNDGSGSVESILLKKKLFKYLIGGAKSVTKTEIWEKRVAFAGKNIW